MPDFNSLLAYSSTKMVVVKSIRLRLIKLAVELMVLGWLAYTIFLSDEGYQTVVLGTGFWTTKAHGVAVSEDRVRLWDAVDFMQPAKMENEAFLVTNSQVAVGQARGVCNGTDDKTEICSGKRAVAPGQCCCAEGESTANGIATGNCTSDGKVCKVRAWCPVVVDEEPALSTSLDANLGKTKLSMRNFARWEEEGVFLDSKAAFADLEDAKSKWSVDKLLKNAGTSYKAVRREGAIVAVHAEWNCVRPMGHSTPDPCEPTFTAFRLDEVEDKHTFSTGSNFRYKHVYRLSSNPDQPRRDLVKVFGINIVFLTTARLAVFDPVVLGINIGSGIGLLVLAEFMADTITMWALKRSAFYRNKKFMNVHDQALEITKARWRPYLTEEEFNKALV